MSVDRAGRSRSRLRARHGILAAAVVAAAAANAGTHCAPGEIVYFSCALERSQKVVSLCGSGFKDPETHEKLGAAWLQYRFGALGSVELAYPKDRAGSLKQFAGEYHHPYRGFSHSLSFTNKDALYSLDVIESEVRFQGLSVFVGGRNRKMRCAARPEHEFAAGGNDFFELVKELDPNK